MEDLTTPQVLTGAFAYNGQKTQSQMHRQGRFWQVFSRVSRRLR